jgi:magnesium transporter
VIECLDALEEWPDVTNRAVRREREMPEHIERVLIQVRQPESSSEAAVQVHFSAQSHRANAICAR